LVEGRELDKLMSDKRKEPAADQDSAMADAAGQMREFRERIDRLDAEIVRLLNARAECALALGRLKEAVGLDTYQPERELAVLEHARATSGGPLDAAAITRLFERIIDENRRLERLAERKDARS
jgi:chorismate mutase-like protein